MTEAPVTTGELPAPFKTLAKTPESIRPAPRGPWLIGLLVVLGIAAAATYYFWGDAILQRRHLAARDHYTAGDERGAKCDEMTPDHRRRGSSSSARRR